jgi:hypothetical protein
MFIIGLQNKSLLYKYRIHSVSLSDNDLDDLTRYLISIDRDLYIENSASFPENQFRIIRYLKIDSI